MEENDTLRNLQNGLRQGRGFKDNLHAVKRGTEIAMAGNRPLRAAFMNIKGAYDNANREFLCSILKPEEFDGELMYLLEVNIVSIKTIWCT